MDLAALGAANPPASADTFTAVVVRAAESGLWVAADGDDPRHPVGPCRGGWTANGTRVPVGAVVALTYTETEPWVIGFDNPALAIADGTLAPFDNPSFEEVNSEDGRAAGWSTFWSDGRRITTPGPVPLNKYRAVVEDGGAAHGLRSYRIDANTTTGNLESHEWNLPPGSSIEISLYARGAGVAPVIGVDLWTNVAGSYAGPFGAGAGLFRVMTINPGTDWLRYRGVITLPPTHTRANLFLNCGDDTGIGTVWVDNVDADLVDLDPTAAHQDFLRRAEVTLTGGGTRTVTAGGTVTWSQPFTIAGVGFRTDEAAAGRFEIALPANGTVIPVHSSAARTSHTVAGGVIALNADDALWYELPLGAVAASQPARFHIVGSTNDDAFGIPPHWILVVRRTAWSSTAHAVEYLWGDGNGQDPWRTPSLNAGWSDGTLPGRYTKTDGGLVIMRGRVRLGAGSAFTLPPGYWPTTQHEAIVRDGAGAAALVTVSTAGVVTTAGNNTDHSIATSFAALGG